MNFINPYQLLGINPNMPDLKQLKKSYYRLAMLCHPDKGGNKESMNIVHKCYLYIKTQFDNCQNLKSYEELEKEFELFCKTQTEQPPPFRTIWENSEEYKGLQKFNEEFEKKINMQSTNVNYTNVFKKGYGQFMDASDFQNNYSLISNQNLNNKTMDAIDLKKNEFSFKTDLIIYKEPESTPLGYGQNQRFDITEVDDFSDKLKDNIILNDYKKAFTQETKKLDVTNNLNNRPKTLEELIKLREQL